MKPNQIQQIKNEFELRLHACMEWYSSCIQCEETLDNVRKDVKSLYEEICEKHKLNDPPFIFSVFMEDGFIVVKAINKKLN